MDNKSKTILMILNKDFLPDNRVEQEYKSLKSAGYRIIVIASQEGFNNDEYEIIRINHRTILSKYMNIFLISNPFLAKRVINKLKELGIQKIDVIHVHDLIWAFLGFQLKKYYNSKIVIDFHENYPAWSKDIYIFQPINKKIFILFKAVIKSIMKFSDIPFYINISKIVRTPEKFQKIEDQTLKNCDKFIVISEEYLKDIKTYQNKGIIVSNTKSPEIWNYSELPPFNNKIILSYMGSVTLIRGLDTVINAMSYINQNDYEFNIVGLKENNKLHTRYLNLIKDKNIKNVNLVGHFSDEQEAFKYIYSAHIGVIPILSTRIANITLPHKLFMYMAAGRPVLVSDVKPFKRIIEETNCGLTFKAGDIQDFIKKLESMKNIKLLKELGMNGRKAVEGKYNWENDSKRLIQMYEELM